jgi:hypothetical protein
MGCCESIVGNGCCTIGKTDIGGLWCPAAGRRAASDYSGGEQ